MSPQILIKKVSLRGLPVYCHGSEKALKSSGSALGLSKNLLIAVRKLGVERIELNASGGIPFSGKKLALLLESLVKEASRISMPKGAIKMIMISNPSQKSVDELKRYYPEEPSAIYHKPDFKSPTLEIHLSFDQVDLVESLNDAKRFISCSYVTRPMPDFHIPS